MVILELIHAIRLRTSVTSAVIRSRPDGRKPVVLMTLDNLRPIAWPCAGDVSFECLTYQLSMVGDVPTMVVTGNGESGFDSGEGA